MQGPSRGSSPLARGLQAGLLAEPRSQGIIPARAGFTPVLRWRASRRRDHPRSRGVYPRVAWGGGRGRGSSPLARGLRVPDPRGDRARRIIPARAGFTGYSPQRSDNPGIIPARAGFTPRGRDPRRPRPDHPRSRGVYRRRARRRGNPGGSSPLARGLLDHEDIWHWGEGIIPARAGFTSPPTARAPATADHPRSRGVYHLQASAVQAMRGSSPLARGLPTTIRRSARRWRIIPARAGFTHRPRRHELRHRDHPRSRGVYSPRSTGMTRVGGSSPLARGLQRGPGAHPTIPMDHPRSRGVYGRRTRSWTPESGSSPLARGLPLTVTTIRQTDRIIPARAGFTVAVWDPCRVRQDHPRSRGVYWE